MFLHKLPCTLANPDGVAAMLPRIARMRHDHSFADAAIEVQQRTFRVHRVVLAAHSDYFDALFKNASSFSEQADGLCVRNATASAFEKLLDFMYTGRCTVGTTGELADVFAVAHMCGVGSLVTALERELMVQVDACTTVTVELVPTLITTLMFADRYSLAALDRCVVRCMAGGIQVVHDAIAAGRASLEGITHPQMLALLEVPETLDCSEEVMFALAKAWLETARSTTDVDEASLLERVRFAFLPAHKRRRLEEDCLMTKHRTVWLGAIQRAYDRDTVLLPRSLEVSNLAVGSTVRIFPNVHFVKELHRARKLGWTDGAMSDLVARGGVHTVAQLDGRVARLNDGHLWALDILHPV